MRLILMLQLPLILLSSIASSPVVNMISPALLQGTDNLLPHWNLCRHSVTALAAQLPCAM